MFKRLKDLFSSTNTLYYPGCLTQTVLPEIQKNYETILNRLGIDFIMLKTDINCCGSPALNAGYTKDFEDLKEKNINILKQYSIGKIITNCPACYHILKNRYNLEVLHMTQVIAPDIKKLHLKKDNTETITYHDPCHLGRHSGIFDEPRDIIRHMGYTIRELPRNREQSLCCGGGGGVRSNYKDISDKVAENILKVTKTKRLVTTCPLCYAHLKENTEGKYAKIEILELSELITKNMKQ
ncbi:MAG: (Fe-S)-binding protein [archaeon]